MIKYHLFKSKKHPQHALTVGERDDGTYFIPTAMGTIDPESNSFDSIEQLELTLEDELTLILPKNQVN